MARKQKTKEFKCLRFVYSKPSKPLKGFPFFLLTLYNVIHFVLLACLPFPNFPPGSVHFFVVCKDVCVTIDFQ